GAIDNYPLEVGYRLADQVLATFREPFAFNEQAAVATTFRYDMNARIRHYHGEYADGWIDFSDRLKKIKNLGPTLSWDMEPYQSQPSFMMAVPDDLEEYGQWVDAQWDYAQSRAFEAVKRPVKNDQSHIRMVQKSNKGDAR